MLPDPVPRGGAASLFYGKAACGNGCNEKALRG